MDSLFKNCYLCYKDRVFNYALMHFYAEDLAAHLLQKPVAEIFFTWDVLEKQSHRHAKHEGLKLKGFQPICSQAITKTPKCCPENYGLGFPLSMSLKKPF